MVKVVEFSKEKIKEKEIFSRLEEITKELLPGATIATFPDIIIQIFINEEYSLSTYRKEGEDCYSIDVHHAKAFQKAIRLAEAYEKFYKEAGEPKEITVNKMYRK